MSSGTCSHAALLSFFASNSSILPGISPQDTPPRTFPMALSKLPRAMFSQAASLYSSRSFWASFRSSTSILTASWRYTPFNDTGSASRTARKVLPCSSTVRVSRPTSAWVVCTASSSSTKDLTASCKNIPFRRSGSSSRTASNFSLMAFNFLLSSLAFQSAYSSFRMSL